MQDGYVSRNVASLVRLPKVPKPQSSWWEVSHVRAFTEHTRGDRHQALWLGEALGLRWEDVTLETDDGAWPHARVARQCWRSAGRPCGASPRPTRVFVSSYSIQPRSRPRHTAASRRLVAGVPLMTSRGCSGTPASRSPPTHTAMCSMTVVRPLTGLWPPGLTLGSARRCVQHEPRRPLSRLRTSTPPDRVGHPQHR